MKETHILNAVLRGARNSTYPQSAVLEEQYKELYTTA